LNNIDWKVFFLGILFVNSMQNQARSTIQYAPTVLFRMSS